MVDFKRLKKLQNTEKRAWKVYNETKGTHPLASISDSVHAREKIVGEKIKLVRTELEEK